MMKRKTLTPSSIIVLAIIRPCFIHRNMVMVRELENWSSRNIVKKNRGMMPCVK